MIKIIIGIFGILNKIIFFLKFRDFFILFIYFFLNIIF